MNKILTLLIIGIWIGLVLGLSFIEAPLKFQAPNITLELGLGIGRLVFGVLNKIEIVFSVLLLILFKNQFKHLEKPLMWLLGFVFLIVFIQSAFLLPILTARVDLILSGQLVEASSHHIIFIFLEAIKLLVLILSFIKTYKHGSLTTVAEGKDG